MHERTVLEVRGLDVRYGPLRAVRGVSLRVESRQIVALLGANGAGKSSVLRAVAGLISGVRGTIELDGVPVHTFGAYRRVARGLGIVLDSRELFPDMSVDENLKMGAYTRRRQAEAVRGDLDWVYSLFPALSARRAEPAGALSGGQAQLVAFGRALMTAPHVLLLDEPSHGLAPALVEDVFALLPRLIVEREMAVLLVEQNADRALRTASYGYVLRTGELALEGPTASLLHDSMVADLYLGGATERGGAV